jgi:hypothetical protein
MPTTKGCGHCLPDWRQAILAGLDTALLVSLPILAAAWFYDPVKVGWGPLHFSASWGVKPILVPRENLQPEDWRLRAGP